MEEVEGKGAGDAHVSGSHKYEGNDFDECSKVKYVPHAEDQMHVRNETCCEDGGVFGGRIRYETNETSDDEGEHGITVETKTLRKRKFVIVDPSEGAPKEEGNEEYVEVDGESAEGEFVKVVLERGTVNEIGDKVGEISNGGQNEDERRAHPHSAVQVWAQTTALQKVFTEGDTSTENAIQHLSRIDIKQTLIKFHRENRRILILHFLNLLFLFISSISTSHTSCIQSDMHLIRILILSSIYRELVCIEL